MYIRVSFNGLTGSAVPSLNPTKPLPPVFTMPLTNIEQAIANVLATKQVPNYNNVFNAYARISRLPFDTFEAEGAFYFDRAIDKYRAPGEKPGESILAGYVARIRTQSMQRDIELMASCLPGPSRSERNMCQCVDCGEVVRTEDIRENLEILREELVEYLMFLTETTPKSKKGVKSRAAAKKTKTKTKKRNGKLVSDPYAPSTSTASY